MKNKNLILLFGIVLCIVALSLCILLIQEFNGNKTSIADAICSSDSGANSCETVAKSDYSGIRDTPIGDIPVALIGFVFYGFILSLFIISLNSKEEYDFSLRLSLIILILGLAIDAALYAVSVFVIGAVCRLCLLTYIITTALLVFNVVILTRFDGGMKMLDFIKEKLFSGILKNLLVYIIIVLFFFACGLGIGKFSNNKKAGNMNEEEFLKSRLERYQKSPVVQIDLSKAPMVGDPNAPVAIVKYADFNCGHCLHTSHILQHILAEYGSLVKIYYKNFPLDGNCNRLVDRKDPQASSCIAATAALCANKQKKFIEVYTSIYDDTENGIRHSVGSIMEIANKHNLNKKDFQSCMSSDEIRNFINKEVDEGEALKIRSTPSLYINNKALDPGTPDIEYLKAIINSYIKK